MATVPTKMSKLSINLSDSAKKVISKNISTETKQKLADYEAYKNQVLSELQKTEMYQNLKENANNIRSNISDNIQKIENSEIYQNTQANISNTIDNAFSIFDNIEDIPEQHNSQPSNSHNEPESNVQSTSTISDGTVTGEWPSDSNQENVSEIEKYLMNEMGLNRAAATAVMANMYHESRFNTTTNGDNGTSYGLSQWHNSRKTNLINYCNKNGYDYTTVEGQMKFYEYELKNSYPKVYEKLKNTPDTAEGAYEAAEYYCIYYEVPANRNEQGKKRGSLAEKQYNSAQ